jgi:hypothetical protein
MNFFLAHHTQSINPITPGGKPQKTTLLVWLFTDGCSQQIK